MEDLPSVDNLRCFDAAARTLNFRAAARAVSLTPAAFGQRIKQLEEQLGSRLFERTTRQVRLTEAGLALVPKVRIALGDLRDCARVVQGDVVPESVEVTLGTRFELGMSWVVPALRPLAKEHPHLLLHLYFGSGADLLARLRLFEIDCAITSSRVVEPKLDSVALHDERYVFVGAPRLLAKKPMKRAAHAAEHTLLDINASMPLYRYAKEAPTYPEGVHFARHRWLGAGAAIKHLVLAGEGLAVLPRYMVQAELDKKRLETIFPKVKTLRDSFRLVFRRDDPHSSIYEAMAATLRTRPIT